MFRATSSLKTKDESSSPAKNVVALGLLDLNDVATRVIFTGDQKCRYCANFLSNKSFNCLIDVPSHTS